MPRGRDLEELKAQLPEEWKEVPILSYSQISKADHCSFLWYIDYHLRAESKKNNTRMDTGTYGHEFLKDLYRAIADEGITPHAWVEERLPDSIKRIVEDKKLLHSSDQFEALSIAASVIERYARRDQLSILGDHTPVGVEQHFYVLVELPDGRRFVLQGYTDLVTIDSLNRIWCWDHKFSDGLWSPFRAKMFIQLVVYQVLLRVDGMPVYGGILNNINSHKYKNHWDYPDDKLFERKYLYRTEGELSNFWTEFLAMAAHVLDLIEGKIRARRSINDFDCAKCHRMIPCHANLLGDPLPEAIQRYTDHQVTLRSQVVGTEAILELD